jgi:hypothetical protein
MPPASRSRIACTLALAAVCGLAGVVSAADARPLDVCVYGGTSGGTIAAVAAARRGSRVVLIEPGRRLGGMSSGGLGMTDNGATSTITGLAREFYERVYRFYRDPENWRHQRREDFVASLPSIWGVDGPRMEKLEAQFIFEPRAAERVFTDLVGEAGVTVVFGERLDLTDGVSTRSGRIHAIRMESGREFVADVFIDATYEGDLMAKAGVSYVVGREPNDRYGETLNGSFPFTPRAFPAISPFVVAGDPASGLLPRVSATPSGPKGSGDDKLQAYNFRVCLTDVPENRVAIEKPADYDPREYELLARMIATMKNVRPGSAKTAAVALAGPERPLGITFHRIPNAKTDSNSGGEFGSDMVGGNAGWPEGDYETRERIFARHKTYVLGLLWFLGNDPRVPRAVREEMQRWGLPRDEFPDTGHFPHQLYVREARRMVSDVVMTERHARGELSVDDGIALASYPLDCHGIALYVDERGVLHRERGFMEKAGPPFPISYRSIRPRAEQCANLLVVSCLSASHAAYGSVRMEPVFMMLGHAAGAAADLARRAGSSVQEVNVANLREALVTDGQLVDWPAR